MSARRLCSKPHAVHVLSRSMEELIHNGAFLIYEEKKQLFVGRYPCAKAVLDPEDGLFVSTKVVNNLWRDVANVSCIVFILRDIPICEETFTKDGDFGKWGKGEQATFHMELTYILKNR